MCAFAHKRAQDGLEARVTIPDKFCAFPGIINGGVLGTIMDCHGNVGRIHDALLYFTTWLTVVGACTLPNACVPRVLGTIMDCHSKAGGAKACL